MKILAVKIENFLTIGEATVNLDDKGLVLVQGINNDDPSADSNGAGKSSLPDAICWALYGVTARGVSGDAVINKGAEKGCRVAVTVHDGDDVYTIRRHRKHPTGKNGLTVSQFDAADLGKSTVTHSDMTKGTDKLTQAVVDKIMGCSVDVFRAAVYAGQEAMPDLPGMTDKYLKLLVEEAAGIDKLQRGHEVARERLKTVTADMTAAEKRLEAQELKVEHTKAGLERAEADRKKWAEERDKSVAAKKADAKAKLEHVKHLEAKADPDAVETLKAELKALTEKLEGREREDEEYRRLNDEAGKFDRLIAGLQHAEQSAKREVDRLKRKIDSINEQVGKPCGECGKTYCEADLGDALTIAKATLAKAIAELRETRNELKATTEDAESARKRATDFRSTMTDVTKVVHAQKATIASLREAETLERDIASARQNAKHLLLSAKEELERINPFDASIEEATKALKIAEAAVIDAKQGVQGAERNQRIASDVVHVFGPAGVRAHILDTVTPYLNDRTAHYLGAMSDGNITAVWSTLSKKSNGELREKFAIEVSNDKGAETFAGLSGGEKRKVRLATAMALQDLVASRATKPIDLFIADEVDHALDEAGLERLMGILDEKARDRGTVLVISHNELSDWIRDQAIVTKTGGVATIEGVLS